MKAKEPLSLLLPFEAAPSAISIGEDCACGPRHNCKVRVPLIYHATPGLKSEDRVFTHGFGKITRWKSPDHSTGLIEEESQRMKVPSRNVPLLHPSKNFRTIRTG